MQCTTLAIAWFGSRHRTRQHCNLCETWLQIGGRRLAHSLHRCRPMKGGSWPGNGKKKQLP